MSTRVDCGMAHASCSGPHCPPSCLRGIRMATATSPRGGLGRGQEVGEKMSLCKCCEHRGYTRHNLCCLLHQVVFGTYWQTLTPIDSFLHYSRDPASECIHTHSLHSHHHIVSPTHIASFHPILQPNYPVHCTTILFVLYALRNYSKTLSTIFMSATRSDVES